MKRDRTSKALTAAAALLKGAGRGPAGFAKVLTLREQADRAWFEAMELKRQVPPKAAVAFRKAAKAFLAAADLLQALGDEDYNSMIEELRSRARASAQDASALSKGST